MKSAAIFALFFVAAIAKQVYFCEVPVTVDDSVSSSGITLDGTSYGWENFNAISFKSFTAGDGDVEGRLSVRDNFSVKKWSNGYELRTGGTSALDMHLPYSTVVGGDASWSGGATYPLGTGLPYAGLKENILVGGIFSAPQDLLNVRATGNRAALNAAHDNAQAYYLAVSKAFANMKVNAPGSVVYSAFVVNCTSNDAVAVTSVFSSDINKVNEFAFNGCNGKTLVINVVMNTPTTNFNGGYPTTLTKTIVAETAVWNLIGKQQVSIKTRVDGNFLAPEATIKKHTGVTEGFFVAYDMQNMNQINRVNCKPPKTDAPYKCVEFEADCATTKTPLFSFTDYGVVSFGNFKAETGDVEGRLAVAGDCSFGTGYSVGAVLSTRNNIPDRSVSYSLVCGGSLSWGNGQLFPDGSDIQALGDAENAAYVGAASGPAHLADRFTKVANLSEQFALGRTCYNNVQSKLNALQKNVEYTSEYGGLTITCSNSADRYVMNIDGAELSAVRYYVTSGCRFAAQWVINVGGTGNVEITGDTFPAIPGGVVYNIVGCGRTIYVHDVALGGHIIAPCNTLNQASGVIIGKVVAGDVKFSLQINRENTCPNIVLVKKTLVCEATATGKTVSIVGADELRVKDDTTFGAITAINGNKVTFTKSVTCTKGANVGTASIPSVAGRYQYTNEEQESSASTAAVAFGVVAAAALLL